jgi:hypothetical protein
VLAHNGHENGDLAPFLHLNPGEGRARSSFMGEAADHFAGLAACTKVRENRYRIYHKVLLRTPSVVCAKFLLLELSWKVLYNERFNIQEY